MTTATTIQTPAAHAGRGPFDELRGDGLRPGPIAVRGARDALYLGLGFPIGLAICCVIGTLAITSIASALLIIGIPLALLTLELARWAAELERGRARIVDDRPIAGRYGPRPRSAAAYFESLRAGRPWRDFAFGLIAGPLTFVAGLVAFVGWTMVLGLALAPTYYWAFDGPQLELLGMQVDGLPEALVAMAVGLALLPVAFVVCRLAAWGSVEITRLVLGDREPAAATGGAGPAEATQAPADAAPAA